MTRIPAFIFFTLLSVAALALCFSWWLFAHACDAHERAVTFILALRDRLRE